MERIRFDRENRVDLEGRGLGYFQKLWLILKIKVQINGNWLIEFNFDLIFELKLIYINLKLPNSWSKYEISYLAKIN